MGKSRGKWSSPRCLLVKVSKECIMMSYKIRLHPLGLYIRVTGGKNLFCIVQPPERYSQVFVERVKKKKKMSTCLKVL